MNNEMPTTKSKENMIVRLWQYLTSPHPSVQQGDQRRRAQLLATMSLLLTVSLSWAILSRPTSYETFIFLFSTALISYVFSRTPYYDAASYFFSFGLTAITYISLYLGSASSLSASLSTIGHVSIIVASILLPLRGLLVLVTLATAATFMAPLYSQTRVLADANYYRDAGVFMSIGIILIGANIFRAWIERARLDEVHAINRELEDVKNNLEGHVAERTAALDVANKQTSRRAAQLQAITELSEAISQVQDLGSLFQTTTHLISERFDFYHVGIFLIDHAREYAIMQAANSEGGQRMLARGHRLKLGTGLVGYVAQLGQPRIALDVGTDAIFFDNPDLPDTRSEAALPLKARGETIGVLDVQSTEAGAFSREDLHVLTALANQVSIAFENTRLLTETRAALKQVEEVYDEFTRAEWSRAAVKAEQAGFRYQTGRIEMIEKLISTPEVVSAVKTGGVAMNQTDGSQEKGHTVAVPVKLRGEVIGVLQIESNDPSKTWQADEIGLVEAVAERAAFALENSRLFQDARRRAAKERLISEATSKISGALNLENILQTTAQELERVLGGSEVLIRFQTKESK
jgi:GAF domain-containing protein